MVLVQQFAPDLFLVSSDEDPLSLPGNGVLGLKISGLGGLPNIKYRPIGNEKGDGGLKPDQRVFPVLERDSGKGSRR